MLLQNKSKLKSNDWTTYYRKETCYRVGVNPELPLVICGRAPEPQHSWNSQTGKYDGRVNAYGYWVNQFVKDSQGNDWIQNPILVIVDGNKPLHFQFGQEVELKGLAAYYSKKKYCYKFRAKEIEVKNVRND